MPKGIPNTKKLTEKERKFVEHITNIKAKSFFNPVSALELAGYDLGRNKTETACKILIRPHIVKALKTENQRLYETTNSHAEYSRQWLWNELLELLNECKISKDRTNWGATLYKMGEIHAAWVQKLVIAPERVQELNENTRIEALELARLRLLQQHNNIDTDFETESEIKPGPGSESELKIEPKLDSGQNQIGSDILPIVETEAIITTETTTPLQIDYNTITGNELKQ